MYDVVIVGAGTAGLTAAIYARRAEKSVLVIESGAPGGQIINTPDIENYPAEEHISGFEFAEKLCGQAKNLGAVIISDRAAGVEPHSDGTFTVRTAKGEYAARSVILATGSANRKLGLDGEDMLVGRGISYCATCDGNFYRGKTVAVNGGGNTALEDALYLSGIASKVYLIHRRDAFRGDESTAERLRSRENVEFVLNSRVTGLIYDKRLRAVEVTDASGNVSRLDVNGLFVAIGRIPENQSFSNVIELDGTGYAVSGEDCRTATPGVFVAGDNRAKEVRQLVTAASDGAVSAAGAIKYISSLSV